VNRTGPLFRYIISLPFVVVAVFFFFLFIGLLYAAEVVSGKPYGKWLLG